MNSHERFESPKACNLGQAAISNTGEYVAKTLGYKPGDELGPIVSGLGGEIVYQNLSELELSTSGSIDILGENRFKIFLATHTSELRDRFTICHEVGHYILHFILPRVDGKKIERLRAARYGNDLTEYEANWFAAGFLMPKEAFSVAVKESNGDMDLVSAQFKVSKPACEIRAKALKLI